MSNHLLLHTRQKEEVIVRSKGLTSLIFPQVFQGRLDSLAVATIKALTTVMHKSPAAKVTGSQTNAFHYTQYC